MFGVFTKEIFRRNEQNKYKNLLVGKKAKDIF